MRPAGKLRRARIPGLCERTVMPFGRDAALGECGGTCVTGRQSGPEDWRSGADEPGAGGERMLVAGWTGAEWLPLRLPAEESRDVERRDRLELGAGGCRL